MSRQKAKNTINNSPIHISLKNRACTLIDNPTDLDQNVFGICGVISIIYLLLKLHPLLFAALAIAASIDTSLIQKAKQAYNTQLHAKKNPRTDVFLDFLIGHYLISQLDNTGTFSGHIMHCQEHRFKDSVSTSSQKGTDIIAAQRVFSGSFNIKDWEKLGHFALKTDAVNYIMNSVIHAKLSLAIQTDTNFLRTWTRVQAAIGNAKTPFILAAIRNAGAWTSGTEVSTAHLAKKTDPEFTHWVVIKSITQSTVKSDCYDVEFWTWAQEYRNMFKKTVISSYLHSMVYGFLED